jgi:hypothetical protein
MTAETIRLSVTDAAIRLGVSADTVRRKLKRGQLRAQRDNHEQWWVEVPADAEAAEPMQRAAYEPMSAAVVDELRAQLRRLGVDLDAAHAREAAERDRHAAEITRLEARITAEMERLADAKAERDRWAGIAEANQREIVRLAEPRRGWWPWRRAG